jgi:hypothetical protein
MYLSELLKFYFRSFVIDNTKIRKFTRKLEKIIKNGKSDG